MDDPVAPAWELDPTLRRPVASETGPARSGHGSDAASEMIRNSLKVVSQETAVASALSRSFRGAPDSAWSGVDQGRDGRHHRGQQERQGLPQQCVQDPEVLHPPGDVLRGDPGVLTTGRMTEAPPNRKANLHSHYIYIYIYIYTHNIYQYIIFYFIIVYY